MWQGGAWQICMWIRWEVQSRVPEREIKASEHLAVKICVDCGNGRNCQKIKLRGTLTIKELKKHSSNRQTMLNMPELILSGKKHSSRPVGGVEMGTWGEQDPQQVRAGGSGRQGGGWQTRISYIRM